MQCSKKPTCRKLQFCFKLSLKKKGLLYFGVVISYWQLRLSRFLISFLTSISEGDKVSVDHRINKSAFGPKIYSTYSQSFSNETDNRIKHIYTECCFHKKISI